MSFLYFHKAPFSQIKYCLSRFCQEDLISLSIFQPITNSTMSRFSPCQFYFATIISTSNSHFEFDKRKIAWFVANSWENCQQFLGNRKKGTKIKIYIYTHTHTIGGQTPRTQKQAHSESAPGWNWRGLIALYSQLSSQMHGGVEACCRLNDRTHIHSFVSVMASLLLFSFIKPYFRGRYCSAVGSTEVPVRVLAALLLTELQVQLHLGGQWKMVSYLGLPHPCERPRWSCCFIGSACNRPGY